MSDGTTPGRQTAVVFDTPMYVPLRQDMLFQRRGDQIGAAETSGRQNSNVQLIAGDTWALDRTYQGWEAAALSSAVFVTDADGNLVPNGAMYYSLRKLDDLNGVEYPAGFAQQSVPVFRKLVGAGDSFNQSLETDEGTVLRPTLGRETVALNRVFAGTHTYPANQAFLFFFHAPGGTSALDWLMTFHFGGPVEADFVPGKEAEGVGKHAISFRGDGTAWLWAVQHSEGEGAVWIVQDKFRYSDATRSVDGWHFCSILPHQNNRIIFICRQAAAAPSGGSLFDAFRLGSRKLPVDTFIHRHSIAKSGHAFLNHITGAGPVRVDARSDMRWTFGIGIDGWKEEGTLYDLPFRLTRVVPEGTTVRILADYDTPTGTTLAFDLFRADTDEAVEPGANDGDFLTPASVTEYYVKMSFAGDGSTTPLLRNYTALVPADIQLLTRPTQVGLPENISISSADLDPSHESAQVLFEDLGNSLTKLSERARIPVQIQTTGPFGTSVLFEGEVARATSGSKLLPRGRFDTYPSLFAKARNVLMVGRWARLYEKVSLGPRNYSQDFSADPDPVTGLHPPWKITDIIRDLFNLAGVPDEQLDIPDIDLRLFPPPNSDKDIYLKPKAGEHYAAHIWELARLYLDAFILYDANAGVRGLWRLLFAPQQPYLPLWDFVLGPVNSPGPVHHPDLYGSQQTFINRDTYQRWPQAPEANHVIVWGAGERVGDTQFKVLAHLQNFRSYDPDPSNPTADPSHPDYLGYELPLIYPDPSIPGQAAANFICRRLFDAVAYGRVWAAWESPLVLVRNILDTKQVNPRPLRLGDVVRLDGDLAMIRSSQVTIDKLRGGDAYQWATYQGVFL